MILHPTIHLEIARQRQRDLLAEAKRQRIAEAVAHERLVATHIETRNRRHFDVETGLEL